MGLDEDDEHAEDAVCDDHWGVAVAETMSEVAREDEASKAKAERYLQPKGNFNRGVGNFNAVGEARPKQKKQAQACFVCHSFPSPWDDKAEITSCT